MRPGALLLALAVGIAVTYGHAASAAADPQPELAVIVHADNPAVATAADLEAWFLRKERRWDGGATIIPINQPPDAVGRHVFDRAVLGMSPDEAARYWLDQRIRAGDNAPREIADAVITVKLVSRLAGAVAYVPAAADLRGVRVVALIRDGKLTPAH